MTNTVLLTTEVNGGSRWKISWFFYALLFLAIFKKKQQPVNTAYDGTTTTNTKSEPVSFPWVFF